MARPCGLRFRRLPWYSAYQQTPGPCLRLLHRDIWSFNGLVSPSSPESTHPVVYIHHFALNLPVVGDAHFSHRLPSRFRCCRLTITRGASGAMVGSSLFSTLYLLKFLQHCKSGFHVLWRTTGYGSEVQRRSRTTYYAKSWLWADRGRFCHTAYVVWTWVIRGFAEIRQKLLSVLAPTVHIEHIELARSTLAGARGISLFPKCTWTNYSFLPHE